MYIINIVKSQTKPFYALCLFIALWLYSYMICFCFSEFSQIIWCTIVKSFRIGWCSLRIQWAKNLEMETLQEYVGKLFWMQKKKPNLSHVEIVSYLRQKFTINKISKPGFIYLFSYSCIYYIGFIFIKKNIKKS